MRFAALRAPWYRGYLTGGSLLMAGDNAEHAITYLAMWQYFHSPLLAGFATISHWLPHLLFSIPFGALADRFDCRRIIQVSAGLFGFASVAWGVLLITGTLEPWHAVVLLLMHGFASALWHPADQLMLFDLVGEKDLRSGVRLMATGLSLGQLVGPAFGAVLLFTVGPAIGMFVNVAFYVPFVVYLAIVPIDGHRRRAHPLTRIGLRDVFAVIGELPRYPAILVVMLAQGGVALFIGTALLPLLPEFGALLGQDESGLGYGLLLVAMAAGAVVGGLALESIGRIPASIRLAVASAAVFAACCLVFALSRSFPLTLVVLLIAGVASLVSASTSQTIVQLEAPEHSRGRFVGAAGMASMGLRVGSGILIGVFAQVWGVPVAVVIDSTLLLLLSLALLLLVVAVQRRAANPGRAGFSAPRARKSPGVTPKPRREQRPGAG